MVDNTRKHSLMTVPSLLGLPANLDLKGKSVIAARQDFDRVAAESTILAISGRKEPRSTEIDCQNISIRRPLSAGDQPAFRIGLAEIRRRLRAHREPGTGDHQPRLERRIPIRGSIQGKPIDVTAQNLSGAMNIADGLVPKDIIGYLKRDGGEEHPPQKSNSDSPEFYV